MNNKKLINLYNNEKTSFVNDEIHFAKRSFSLFKENLYELRSSFQKDEIDSLLFKRRKSIQKMQKFCKTFNVFVPDLLIREKEC